MPTRQPRRGHRLHHGEGTFYYSDTRGLWVGKLEAGTSPDGRRRRIEVSSRDEDLAWDKLQTKRKTLLVEGAAAAMQKSITVKAWMTTWLTITETKLRPRSQRAFTSYTNRWIIPTLGTRKLEQLSAADARKLTDTVLAANLSSTTAGKVLETLQAALRRARADGYTVPEPVLMVEKPAAAAVRRDAIPIDQALPLVRHIATVDDAARWVAALLQGMRQGECLGLTWDAIDWDNSTIDVSWQLQPLPYADRAAGTFRVPHGYEHRRLEGAWHLVRPKTNKGRRLIPMVPWLADSLRQRQTLAPASPHNLVWPRPDGRPRSDREDREAWYALQQAANVAKPDGSRYVLHEARHTTATLLLMAGVDPAIIQEIMGHSDITTTRGYQHAPRALLLQALEKVAGQLELR